MWKDDNDKIDELWKIFQLLHERFPCQCPICGRKSAHIYMHRYKKKNSKGTVWMWCSECRSCSHGTFSIPEWWINDTFVDMSKTASHPDYLDSIKQIIDNYVNQSLDELKL